jgi:S1-C subfamily serine protease
MDRNKWITCGVIGVVVLCIGVFSLGGLAVIGSWFGDTTPTLIASKPTITSLPANSPAPINDPSGPTPEPVLRSIPFEAVVQIITFYYEDNRLIPGWTGSGSIISPDGLILTNSHVVLPDRYFPVDALAVAFTVAEDRPPEIRYYAEVLQASEPLDIAVIQITTDLNNTPVDLASLNLPYVPLGNADDLRLGDQITVLGYPGIGGETITLTRGEVSGFTSESGSGDRAFIKTSATIAGGNSGGLAADAAGYLIGIPTQLGYGGDDQYVDCRVLADTNRDGIVDDRDNCVPTGGFINALRPINLALPLIEAARAGQVAVHHENVAVTPEVEMPSEGAVLYSDDFSTTTGDWAWSGSEGSVAYGNGELEIEIISPEYIVWGLSGGTYTDTVIDVDTRVIQSAGDGDFGILCRLQDKDNFYGMEISEDGYFTIWKRLNGEHYDLVEWTPSSLIDTSRKAILTAICVGDELSLMLDGDLLAEVKDSDLSSGDVGLVAGTWDGAPIVVGFDNFVVREPGN